MPLILRACHVDELAEGTSTTVKVRGRRVRLAKVAGTVHAFDASATSVPSRPTPADLDAARRDGIPFRVVVRGAWIHVAVDADRQAAPAAIQENDRRPEPARS